MHILIKLVYPILLIIFLIYAQSDTITQNDFYLNIGKVKWYDNIDSMVTELKEMGIDSCQVSGINNHFTLGPSISCSSGDLSLGIGYLWDKDYIPYISFFMINYTDCETCQQTFDSLHKIGYIERKNVEPLNVNKRFRLFQNDTLDNVGIELWNECCPGNRIKAFLKLTNNGAE